MIGWYRQYPINSTVILLGLWFAVGLVVFGLTGFAWWGNLGGDNHGPNAREVVVFLMHVVFICAGLVAAFARFDR